jgi:(5-formylfuran-3-yl)methyl phosphate synthase
MTKLLTSVRNLDEAKIVCRAGSDWLDLKEPNDGALGAVSHETIAEVVTWADLHAPAIPISATIGDCWDDPSCMPEKVRLVSQHGVDYVKVGIYADELPPALTSAIRNSIAAHANLIVLCFAEKPPTAEAIKQIAKLGAKGLMLDTAEKKTGRLTEKMTPREIVDFVAKVQELGCLCGIAGSLQEADVNRLVDSGADYLGFRGALCTQGERVGDIAEAHVARLKEKMQKCLALKSTKQFKANENA